MKEQNRRKVLKHVFIYSFKGAVVFLKRKKICLISSSGGHFEQLLMLRKLEEKLQKVEGVNTCNVSFMMQRISLDIEDSKAEEIINNIKKVCKKVEPDMEIVRG